MVPLPSEGSYAATLTLTDFAGEAHSLTSEFHTRDLVQEVHTAPRGCVMTSGGPHHPWWILIGMATVAIRRGYGGRSR